MITADNLKSILPSYRYNEIPIYIDHLNNGMREFDINTRYRVCAFIANVLLESGYLSRVRENMNYTAEQLIKTWPSRFNSGNASQYAKNPEKLANYIYGYRMGNILPDDGWRYRGGGLLQDTGKDMFVLLSKALGLDLVSKPELIEQPEYAARSACWTWYSKGLNKHADLLCSKDNNECIKALHDIRRGINGGLIGYDDMAIIYNKALEVIK